jgi:hypothetical protein
MITSVFVGAEKFPPLQTNPLKRHGWSEFLPTTSAPKGLNRIVQGIAHECSEEIPAIHFFAYPQKCSKKRHPCPEGA